METFMLDWRIWGFDMCVFGNDQHGKLALATFQ